MIREVNSLNDIKAEIGYSIRELEFNPNINFKGWIRGNDINTSISTLGPNNIITGDKNDVSPGVGLTPLELKTISLIISLQDAPNEEVSVYLVKNQSSRAGFTDVEFNIGIRKLIKKGLLKVEEAGDWRGDSYNAFLLTETGEEWILNNENLILSISE